MRFWTIRDFQYPIIKRADMHDALRTALAIHNGLERSENFQKPMTRSSVTLQLCRDGKREPSHISNVRNGPKWPDLSHSKMFATLASGGLGRAFADGASHGYAVHGMPFLGVCRNVRGRNGTYRALNVSKSCELAANMEMQKALVSQGLKIGRSERI